MAEPTADPSATLASRPPENLHVSGDTVLLVIDMQVGFDAFPRRNNPACEANVAALLAAWRTSRRPIIHVRHDSKESRSVFRPGQPGNAVKPEARPRPSEEVVAKSAHSAFIGTGLEARLRGMGYSSLVIAGIQTNYCVASTARMAGNLGFRTYVVGDACATFPQPLLDGREATAQDAHDLALAELHGEFATVVTTRAVAAAAAK